MYIDVHKLKLKVTELQIQNEQKLTQINTFEKLIKDQSDELMTLSSQLQTEKQEVQKYQWIEDNLKSQIQLLTDTIQSNQINFNKAIEATQVIQTPPPLEKILFQSTIFESILEYADKF